jgi:hypothetical protein
MREGKVPMPRVPGQADEHARLEEMFQAKCNELLDAVRELVALRAELAALREAAIYESDRKDIWKKRASDNGAELAALRKFAEWVAAHELRDGIYADEPYADEPYSEWFAPDGSEMEFDEVHERAVEVLRAALNPGAEG